MEFSNTSYQGNEFGEDGIIENPTYQYTKTSYIDDDEFPKKLSPDKTADSTIQDTKQYLKGKQDGKRFQGHSWKLNAIIFIIFVMSFSSLVLTVVQRFGNGSLSCRCKTTEQKESMKGMIVEKKDTKIDNLNETVLQLKNVLSKQSGNISHLEAGLNRKIASLQQLALTLNEKIQRETIKREKTIEDVKKQLKVETENHDLNISDLRKEYLWIKTKFNALQQNGSIINKRIQEEKITRENFTKQLTFEQISQNAHISVLRREAIRLDRKVKFLQNNASTLSKTIQHETIERENVTKQLTLEIAHQNTNISYLHEDSSILSKRVELFQQNFTAVKKRIEAERFQREKSIHNATKQLRQNIANQNIATIKKLLLLASNMSKLFQETANNRKLIRDDSHNITKQVNVLRQKQMELDHMNNIVQQNLTEVFNKAIMLNRKMELIQQNESTLNKMIQQEKIERENVTKQLTYLR